MRADSNKALGVVFPPPGAAPAAREQPPAYSQSSVGHRPPGDALSVGAQVEPPSYRQLLEVQVAELESTVAGYEKTRRNLCEQVEIYKSGISPAAVAQAQHHLGLEAEAGACPPDMLSRALAGLAPQARELIEHHHFIKQLDVYLRFPKQQLQDLRAELSEVFPASRGVPQEGVNVAGPAEIRPPYVAPSTDDPEMLRLLGAPRGRQEPPPPVVIHVPEMKHAWEVEEFNGKARNAGATVTDSLVTFLIRVLAGTPITQEDLVWNGKRIHELKAYGTQDKKTQELASEFVKLSAAHRVDTDIGRTVAEKQAKDRQAAAASKAAQAAGPANRSSVLAVPKPKVRPPVADAVPLPDAVSPQSSPMVAAQPAIVAEPPHVANANDKKSRQLRNYLKAEANSPGGVKALAEFVAGKMKGKDPSSEVLWITMEDQPGFKSLAPDAQNLARLMAMVDVASRKQTQVVASLVARENLNLLDANSMRQWGEFYSRQGRFDGQKRQDPVALAAVHALLAQSEAPHPALGKKYADLPGFAALDTNAQTLLTKLDALTTFAYECGKADMEVEATMQRLDLDVVREPVLLRSTAALAFRRSQQLMGSSPEDHHWRAQLFQETAKYMERAILGDL